jgi:hypothetical protein
MPDTPPNPADLPLPTPAQNHDQPTSPSSQTPTTDQEQAIMFDIHEPHESIHTWKDFWIHLGTITAGLLIAISLEQSVEALIRLHERHQLQYELHEESLRAKAEDRLDYDYYARERSRVVALRHDVDAMIASGGKLKLSYGSSYVVDQDLRVLPTDSVWSTAKESSLVGLLPRTEAEAYNRLDRQHDLLSYALDQLRYEQRDIRGFENEFDDASPNRTPDLGRMTIAQLKEYSALLSNELSNLDLFFTRLQYFDEANQALIDGPITEENVLKKMGKFE